MHRNKRRTKSNINRYLVSLVLGAVFLLLVVNAPYNARSSATNIPEFPEEIVYHAHADFKVFVNNKELDFSSPEFNIRSRQIHLHSDNDFGGNVIHVEEREATLGEFFSSLGMKFNFTCFIIDSEFCNTETKTLKFYVNGERNNENDKYKPKDLDRILISYGDKDEDINGQLDSITKLACIFSNKCPIPGNVKIVTL